MQVSFPGGEKVRLYATRMMLSHSNVLILDDPTNHLDLESIQSLNDSLIQFKGSVIFTSHDHQFIQTIANRVIEITDEGVVDKSESYEDYIEAEKKITTPVL